jgi:integrase
VTLHEVVLLFGTLVAETILASVHVRAHNQAGHMGPSDLVKALQNTLRGGGRPHTGNAGLFTRVFTRSGGSLWGRSHQHRPLREACRRAGIDPPASFHIVRHTYATHLLQAGAPLPVIAANLGHSDTRMTERHYAHLVPSHVAQVIRATMPKLGLVEPSPIVSATAMLQR